MEITEFEIRTYGPLRDIKPEIDSGINVFYGRNESGKTLIGESITRMIVGGDAGFDNSRVEADPDGTLLVEKDGEEINASQTEFENLFSDKTNPEDIRNAFVIRDFDLRKPRSNDFNQSDYFNKLTDRIMGADTAKIDEIKEEVAAIGCRTSPRGNMIINRSGSRTNHSDNLREKKNKAEQLINDIEEATSDMKSSGVIEKVSEKKRKENRKEKVVEKIEKFDKAEKYQEIDKAEKILDKLKKINEALEILKEKDEDFENVSKLVEEINDEIDQQNDLDEGFWKQITYLSGFIAGASVLATVLNPLAIVLSLLAGSGIVYAANKYRNARKQRQKENDLLEKARSKNLDLSSSRSIVEDITEDRPNLDLNPESLEEVSEQLSDAVEMYQEFVNSLKTEKNGLFRELKGMFDFDSQNVDEWEEYVEERAEEIGDPDIEYDREKHSELKKEKDKLKRRIQELSGEIDSFRKTLEGFSTDVADIPFQKYIGREFAVETFEDLERAPEILQKFVDEIEDRAETSDIVVEILEEIEEEEKDEFNQIFEDGSYAVEMFCETTDSKYSSIKYDKTSNEIIIERRDGREISPDKLSQGTYDLLYMSIRLQLALELSEGEPGFFILDSPFIHSDDKRLKKEVEFLQSLSDQGWQIIYFSFRESVKQTFKDNCDCKVQELQRLS